MNKSQYEEDFYAWTINQANLLRANQFDKLDFPNLIEEVESIGRTTRRKLIYSLESLLSELLKWQLLPDQRSHVAQGIIAQARLSFSDLLAESPSLRDYLVDNLEEAYEMAILKVLQEIELDESLFPPKCPVTFEEAVNPDFYPGIT